MTHPALVTSRLTDWWQRHADVVQQALRSELDDRLTRLFAVTSVTDDGPIGLAGDWVEDPASVAGVRETRLEVEPMRDFSVPVELRQAVLDWDSKTVDQRIRNLLRADVDRLRNRVRGYLLEKLARQTHALGGRSVARAVAELIALEPGRTYRFASADQRVLDAVAEASQVAVELIHVEDLPEGGQCRGLLVVGTEQRPELTVVLRPPFWLDHIGQTVTGTLRSRLVATNGGSRTYRLMLY